MGYPDDEDRFPWPYAKRLTIACAALLVVAIFAPQCGCASLGVRGDRNGRGDIAQATGYVWHDLYGRTDRAPEVRLVTGSDLVCKQDNGDPGFRTAIGCRGGFALKPGVVSIVYVEGWRASETALAHELKHEDQLRHGIIDPFHALAEWHEVDAANGKLRERGW
jgi:hypothetical protein